MGRESLQGNQDVTIFSGSQKFHPKYFECTELVFVRQLVNTKQSVGVRYACTVHTKSQRLDLAYVASSQANKTQGSSQCPAP